MPWTQEEVDDNSISQVYENTPWSSLNVSITGEDIDEIGFNKYNREATRTGQGTPNLTTRIKPQGCSSTCGLTTSSP